MRGDSVPEPQNLYVKLPGDVADALFRTAHREWRRPKDQALFFIVEGLRRLGELPSEPTLDDVIESPIA